MKLSHKNRSRHNRRVAVRNQVKNLDQQPKENDMEYQSTFTTFTGTIQADLSGQGHNWKAVSPEMLNPDVLEALASENGDIEGGAEVSVGGVNYRAIRS